MAAATNAGHVNINSDLGESFGPWVMGNDADWIGTPRRGDQLASAIQRSWAVWSARGSRAT